MMADYQFDRTASVSAGTREVWTVLTDIPKLVSWISVLQDAREIEHLAEYTAVIADKVGMFRLRADLSLHVAEAEVERRIVVDADGQDRQVGSRVTIHVEVNLSPVGGGTDLRVSGHYGITGSAATLGSSTIQRKGAKVLDEFLTNLAADLSP